MHAIMTKIQKYLHTIEVEPYTQVSRALVCRGQLKLVVSKAQISTGQFLEATIPAYTCSAKMEQ